MDIKTQQLNFIQLYKTEAKIALIQNDEPVFKT